METTPIIIAPVGATPAYPHDTLKVTVRDTTMGTIQAFSYAQTFSVFNLPVVTVPAGKSNDGLPIGVQIAGPPFAEEMILAAAEIVETALSTTAEFRYIIRAIRKESTMDPVATLLAFLFFGFIAIVLLVIAVKTIRIVPQATVMLIERLGSFHHVAQQRPEHPLCRFIDKPRAVYWTNTRPGVTSIDLREQYIDLPPQPVITRDNVTIHVDSVVYWQITDPIKAVYEMNDLVGGIVQLTITGMRAVMGEMDLDHTLSQRDQINAKLRLILDEATDKWGVKVTRVDVKNINPPEDVRITMEKQMTAERNRRALVLQAEGDRQAAITRAEGEKQAAVTRAEGEKQSAILAAEGAAQARLRNAEAESEAITRIAQVDSRWGSRSVSDHDAIHR